MRGRDVPRTALSERELALAVEESLFDLFRSMLVADYVAGSARGATGRSG